MRCLAQLVIILMLLWLTGCASSQTGAQQFSWQTERMPTNFVIASSSFAGSVTVLYQVIADCIGPNCTPDEAELIFSRQSSSNALYLSNTNLSIKAGNEQFVWEGIERERIYENQRVGGLIKSVTLKWEELVQIATAVYVSGNLAGENFEWEYQNRKPLRQFLSKVESHQSN